MRQTFTVMGRLPGLNEYINACRNNKYTGAAMKKEMQEYVRVEIVRSHLTPVEGRCRLQYTFFERNRNRDMDNVSGFAHKVVQDALVEAGVLEGDGWKHIAGYTDNFEIDRDCPRIEVTLIYSAESN